MLPAARSPPARRVIAPSANSVGRGGHAAGHLAGERQDRGGRGAERRGDGRAGCGCSHRCRDEQGREPCSRQGQATPRQRLAELLAGAVQARGDGPLGRAELGGGIRARPAMQVAQHHHRAERFRQLADLLVERRAELGLNPRVFALALLVPARRVGRRDHLPPPPPGHGHPGLVRRPHRHTVQPPADRARRPDGPHAAGEHEEDRLECVLGVVSVPEHAPADAEHGRAVPVHQCGEGVGIAPGSEGGHQIGVGRWIDRRCG